MRKGCMSCCFQVNIPKAKDFRRHCFNVLFPQIRRQLTNKMKEEHHQAIEEKDNQIPAHEQKILNLNEEIGDLIKNRHVARRGYFDNVLCFTKRIAEKSIHTTLFNVNIGILKNISNGSNFFAQKWRRLAGVMIQMLFIDGIYSSMK